MKIRFYNLGQIKETELDLKPMTVIIGPNNSNKTYIAYSVYGIWNDLAEVRFPTQFAFQARTNGSLSIRVENLQKSFAARVKASIGRFEEEMDVFFQDSSGVLFSESRFEMVISPEEFESALVSLSAVTHPLRRVPGFAAFNLSLEKEHLVVSLVERPGTDLGETTEHARTSAKNHFEPGIVLDRALRHYLFSSPHVMPAERNAFIITYKVLANRRLRLMLDAQRRAFSSREPSNRQLELLREAGEFRYPQPTEDFLAFLSDVESDISTASEKKGAARRPNRRQSPPTVFGRLAANIEQTIQNGNRLNFRQTALGGQEIMVDVGNGLNIDLYNASSSIKQLAPLLLYLRYRAAKGDLLIIDEPEMNLHPESQAKLLEVLAMLVNEGVHVLLTTHSPYLLAHLNNLAQTAEASPAVRRKQAKSLYLQNPAAFLQMNQVSAYEMRDNQLHSLKDPDYGIRWDTLSNVSTELQQKFFKIHE